MAGPNYAGLKASIAAAPYSTMTDAQIVAALNTSSVSVDVDVPTADVVDYLALNGLLPTVAGWAKSAPTPPASGLTAAQTEAAVTAAQIFGLMLGPPPQWSAMRMSDPTTNEQITGMVSALVTGGLMPSANATAILAMGKATVTPASTFGFVLVHENDLIAARLLP